MVIEAQRSISPRYIDQIAQIGEAGYWVTLLGLGAKNKVALSHVERFHAESVSRYRFAAQFESRDTADSLNGQQNKQNTHEQKPNISNGLLDTKTTLAHKNDPTVHNTREVIDQATKLEKYVKAEARAKKAADKIAARREAQRNETLAKVHS